MKPVLCIPSYSRPNGMAIERCKELPLKKYLFIRKEQRDLYEKWTPWYHLVLQTNGTDIGLVRKNIVSYCSKKGFDWAFVLDDDIQKVETVGKKPDGTMTANRIIAGVQGPRMEPEAFKVWFKVAKKWGLVLSCPDHRAYDRFNHGKLQINKSPCIQCILLHIPTIKAMGNYKSIHETGNEDYYMQYTLMSQGLLTGKIGSIEYDCPVVGSGSGGNSEEYQKQGSMAATYEYFIEKFLSNVCKDPNLIRIKTNRGGQRSIQFIWKNWSGFTYQLDLKENWYANYT